MHRMQRNAGLGVPLPAASQVIQGMKNRTLLHENEPTSTRWVPSSALPASLTTKDACTGLDCVGSLKKRDGSPSCSAGCGTTIILLCRPPITSLDLSRAPGMMVARACRMRAAPSDAYHRRCIRPGNSPKKCIRAPQFPLCPAPCAHRRLRVAVSWKQNVSGRCRDSVYSNMSPWLSNVWLRMTAR